MIGWPKPVIVMLLTVENVTAFLVGVLCVAVVFFKWRYRYWLVRRVPFLEPKLPFGNTENPLTRDRSMIFIVKGLYDDLRKKGHKHGGKTSNCLVITRASIKLLKVFSSSRNQFTYQWIQSTFGM